MHSLEFYPVVACKVCKSMLKYDCKETGSSHVKRYTEHRKPSPDRNTKQRVICSHFNYKTSKINDSERLDIKNAEWEFRVHGHHAINAPESDGLINLLKQLVTRFRQLLLKQSSYLLII